MRTKLTVEPTTDLNDPRIKYRAWERHLDDQGRYQGGRWAYGATEAEALKNLGIERKEKVDVQSAG